MLAKGGGGGGGGCQTHDQSLPSPITTSRKKNGER